MRRLVLLALVLMFVGCKYSSHIDRHTLDKLYADTALSPDVLSSVPKQINVQASPTVVNWWYAGTSGTEHVLVFRALTWDANGQPIGEEKRYRINQQDLPISEGFMYVKDAARWVPLYEAAADEIEPPTDLPTARQAPEPIDSNPIQLPTEPIVPQVVD